MLETDNFNLKSLANAVKDENFRETLKKFFKSKEASVFEEYSDEYQQAETNVDKKDN